MMKKTILLVWSVLAFAAHANAGEVSILGGLDFFKNSYSPEAAGTTYANASRVTFGVDYHHMLAPNWGLEVGLFWKNNGFKASSSFIEATVVAHSLNVPIMARYTVLPQYLSVGAGVFLGYGVGDITSTAAAGDSTTVTYDVAQRSKFDYGLAASIRGSYPIAQGIEVLGDVRYQYGLKNSSTAAGLTIKTTDLSVLVGARFAM